MTTFTGFVDSFVYSERPKSIGNRNRHAEWDWHNLFPKRAFRRLTGAGYFRADGMNIDEFTDLVISRVPGVDTLDAAMDWYMTTALAELDERQADRAGVVAWEDQEQPDPDA
jgi:hypothetical protein